MKEKAALVSCQHGFMKRKSCLINLIITFCVEMANKVDEGRVVGDFSKAFHNVITFH